MGAALPLSEMMEQLMIASSTADATALAADVVASLADKDAKAVQVLTPCVTFFLFAKDDVRRVLASGRTRPELVCKHDQRSRVILSCLLSTR